MYHQLRQMTVTAVRSDFYRKVSRVDEPSFTYSIQSKSSYTAEKRFPVSGLLLYMLFMG